MHIMCGYGCPVGSQHCTSAFPAMLASQPMAAAAAPGYTCDRVVQDTCDGSLTMTSIRSVLPALPVLRRLRGLVAVLLLAMAFAAASTPPMPSATAAPATPPADSQATAQ